jgi:UDP-glucose 4-epimerase
MTDPTRVLVTGGAGFIGTALCRTWLSRGALVCAFDDFSAGNTRLLSNTHEHLTIRRGSILDANGTHEAICSFRPDILYHLAAVHYIPACERDPLQTLQVNVTGTEAVLLAAETAAVPHIILASSAAVYADSGEPLSERHPLDPRDIYGLTKVFAEQLALRYHRRTARTTTVARFFNVYGPGDTIPHIIPELLNQFAATGGSLHLGNLTPRRDFIAVADVVEALVALTGVPSGRYDSFNVGSGVDYSVQDLVNIVATALKVNVTIGSEEARLRPVDRLRLVADIRKIAEATGWKPTTDLLNGILTTIDAHPQLGKALQTPHR